MNFFQYYANFFIGIIKAGFLLFIINGNFVGAQCNDHTIINGSFESNKGENVVAPGWSNAIGSASPDINDASGPLITSPGYQWIGSPLPSADGGTWQNIYDYEAIEQSITLLPGEHYILNFQYAAQGIYHPSGGSSFYFNGKVGAKVYFDTTLVYATPEDSTQYTWENASFAFVAPTSIVNIKFGASQDQYLAIDGICLSMDTLAEDTISCVTLFEMPNIFTPNSDGINDHFYPVKLSCATDANMSVYNRFGVKLYETEDVINGWDGTHHHQPCSEGTYYWVIRYITDTKEIMNFSGFFTLLR